MRKERKKINILSGLSKKVVCVAVQTDLSERVHVVNKRISIAWLLLRYRRPLVDSIDSCHLFFFG